MVYLKDDGSAFDAPIDFVWSYIFGGEGHDSSHKTTRNSKFGKVSDITILYGSERLLRGKWAPDQLRISMFPPISVVTEWLEGVLAGSKLVYYVPLLRGKRLGSTSTVSSHRRACLPRRSKRLPESSWRRSSRPMHGDPRSVPQGEEECSKAPRQVGALDQSLHASLRPAAISRSCRGSAQVGARRVAPCLR